LLLGLGLRNLSVAPGELLEIKQAIRAVDLGRASALAARVLEAGRTRDVKEALSSSLVSSLRPN
jgi:phosphoenolpyruvate-protein kinase (PTS system EI component)